MLVAEDQQFKLTRTLMRFQWRFTMFVSLGVLGILFPSASHSQHAWNRIKAESLIKFDESCSSIAEYEAAKLDQVVPRILKRYPNPDVIVNRAFGFDLNGDKKPEYFVPFRCGGVGNCDWGVFALNPTRFLGIVNGKDIYVHAQKAHWPDVFGFGHLSAAEGALETYRFNGRYQRQKNPYPIGDETLTLEIQNVSGHKLPAVFTRAKKACDSAE